jgi:hypothetical protein
VLSNTITYLNKLFSNFDCKAIFKGDILTEKSFSSLKVFQALRKKYQFNFKFDPFSIAAAYFSATSFWTFFELNLNI